MKRAWQLTPLAKKRWHPSWRGWMMLAGLILLLLSTITTLPTVVSSVGKTAFFLGLSLGVIRATMIEVMAKPRRRACDLACNLQEAHRRTPH